MRFSTGLLALSAALMPTTLLAHPHIFAEAKLEIVGDEKGQISELRNVWRFDELFSSSVVLDFDANANAVLDPDELAAIGQTVTESLAEYDYYTSIFDNGKAVKVAKPKTINVDYQDGQLLMFFALKPVDAIATKGTLTFGVYDPTMYTAMDFASDDDISVVGTQLSACKHQVVRPDPDEVLAQNQDNLTDAFFSDPAGTDMSKLFATRMEITC